MSPRLLRTVADVMLSTLVIVISVILWSFPGVLLNFAALGLFLFAFAILAEERAEYRRGL